MSGRRYRLLPDAVRLRPELSVPTREGARLADVVYERSKDTLGRLFRGETEVTDQRYTGPDGAKRLEMLEELAEGFADWVRAAPSLFDHRHTRDIAKISKAISWDNGRVSRLKKE